MSTLEGLIGRMTVAELAQFANTSVEAIVATAMGGAAIARASDGARASEARAARGPKAKRGRGSITDEEVLAVIAAAREPVKAEDIRAKIGGSAAQIRTALHRLRDGKKVRVQGQRRGTRYSAR